MKRNVYNSHIFWYSYLDVVVRAHYFKYFHPKECMVGGGIVCAAMCKTLLEQHITTIPFDFTDEKLKIQFVYPYGSTLNVRNPSNVLMTTGAVVYPFNRPLAGYYCNDKMGKILAIGSGYMFEDKYITEETNMSIWDYIVNLLTNPEAKFTSYDFANIDINDNKLIPDTIFMAEQPKICLPESMDCDIPVDFKDMFDIRLHSINNDLLPDVIACYEQVNVKYEPLKLIKPQFEIPLPPLQLAVIFLKTIFNCVSVGVDYWIYVSFFSQVFSPVFSELPLPPLELYDLDEAFSSDRLQLTQLTNKCLANAEENKLLVDEKELEYFILECGRILKVFHEAQTMTAKEILNTMCTQIAQYKKLDREE